MSAARLLSHRYFLLSATLLVITIVVILLLQELQLLLFHSWEDLHQVKSDEESIAILLIGFGVLLEGRQTLLNWAEKSNAPSDKGAPSDGIVTHHCEYFGFLILTVGLFIEIVEQCVILFDEPQVHLITELCINYPLNLCGLYLMLRALLVLVNPNSDGE